MNPSTACYCTPLYTNGCDAIAKVGIRTLLNVSTDCNEIWITTFYILTPEFVQHLLSKVSTPSLLLWPGTGNLALCSVGLILITAGDFQGSGEFFHISDSIPEVSSWLLQQLFLFLPVQFSAIPVCASVIYNALQQWLKIAQIKAMEKLKIILYIILPVGISETILNQVKCISISCNDRTPFALGQPEGQSRISYLISQVR